MNSGCLHLFGKLARIAVAMLALFTLFAWGEATAQIVVDVNVLPQPTVTGMLSIQRVEMVFGNDQPTATVAVNGKLKARAYIRYSGNGALIGQWLVDGRPIQNFNRTLTFGDSIMLETADMPPLPTIEPGPHEVTLSLNSPAVATALPRIRYIVETAPGASLLTLVRPLDGAILVRPRTDGLMPTGKAAVSLSFGWNAPVLTRTANAGALRYKFRVFVTGGEAKPLASATTPSSFYDMPAAVAAALPMGRELLWQVQVTDGQGRLLATSETRRLTLRSPSAIQLLVPVNDAAASEPLALSWSSSGKFNSYEVRGYLNDAMLKTAQGKGDFAIGAQAGQKESTATTRTVFSAVSDKPGVSIAKLDPAVAAPGMALRWLVLGLDGQDRVQDVSEVGDFHLDPGLKTLNGLPVALKIAGFEVSVDSYAPGATLANLSGHGTVHFARDRAQRAIGLDFSSLSVDAYREQLRQVTGSGANARVTVQEILKGRVTNGRIAQVFATPVALDLAGYPVSLRALTLAQDAGGAKANADLDIKLTGYADAAGASPARVPLTAVPLEAGGDFFAEVPGYRIDGLHSISPLMSGLTLLGGRLIADFSLSRDFTGSDGQPVRRDAGVFIMGGDAKLDAAALFPVAQPQTINLGFDALELAATGYSGAFSVTGSGAITPVVPAGYSVTFTGGRFAIDRGMPVASSLFFDGVAKLPSSVRSASGLPPSVRFSQLHPSGDVLESASVKIAEIEWGPSGGVPFRLSNATGVLRLPYRVAGSAATGMRLTAGRLQSPMQFDEDAAAAQALAAAKVAASRSAASSATLPSAMADMVASGVGTLSGKLVDGVNLWVRTAGMSGEIASTARHTAKMGDFPIGITSLSLAFTDGAVTRSSLDGEIVVPKPADFKLAFIEARITGSGDIVGPKIVMPDEITLQSWRAKLLMPAPLTGKKNLAVKTGSAITLSRSYLRFADARLQFLLDTFYGPVEFDEIGLSQLDIGADGQVQASTMGNVNSHFLQMTFVADNASALHFLVPSGDAVAGAPLVTLDGNLNFPTLGARHVTLAHTASGARADNLTPNGGGFGNPDFLRYDAANLVFHNGYAEGKDAYKEFIGTAQVGVLKTLTLGGLMEIGSDTQGNYERVGLGIGVDPLRAASLYSSGPIAIGAKLGVAAVNTATNGRSTAEAEVAQLIGSSVELATESDPKKRVEKLIKSLSDALALAQRIHRETGGKDDDTVGTSFGITNIALTAAGAIAKDAKRDDKKLVLAILDALDLSLAVVEKARNNGQSLPQDVRNGLALARVAAKVAHATVDDGKFSDQELIGIADQLLIAATGFSTDRHYLLVIDVLKDWVAVARTARQNDATFGARLAASALKTVRNSGLVVSPEGRDVMVLGQALIESVVAAKEANMPAPNNVIAVATGVLDAASGPDTTFGGGAGAEAVKSQLKLARRTLELFGTISGGISYAKAGLAVQTTLHEGGTTDPAYVAVDNLVTNWVLMDSRPLATTVKELQNLIACQGSTQKDAQGKPIVCSVDDIAGLVTQTIAEIGGTQTPVDLLAGLRRLKGIKDIALGGGKIADFDTAFDTSRKAMVVAAATRIQTALIGQLGLLTVRHEFARLSALYLGIEQALVRDLGIPQGSVTETQYWVVYKGRAVQFMNDALAELKRATDVAQAKYPLAIMMGIVRQSELIGVQLPDEADAALKAASAIFAQLRQKAEQVLQAATNIDQFDEAQYTVLSLARQEALMGGEANQAGVNTSAAQKRAALQTANLIQKINAGRDGLEPKYIATREALKVASRIEDADEAVIFMRLFEVGGPLAQRQIMLLSEELAAEANIANAGLPAGYTAADREARRVELAALLQQRAPVLLADGLSRMRSAEGVEFRKLANRYKVLAQFKSGAMNDANQLLNNLIAQVPTIDCGSWRSLRDRLDSPMLSDVSSTNTKTALLDLYARCAGTPPAQGPDPVTLYADVRGGEMDGLSKFLKEIDEHKTAGQPEAYLKEQLAWQIAERVKNLTLPFRNGRDADQRTLGRVYDQTDYALRFRQASTPDRVIAGINMMSEPLLARQEIQVEVRDEIRRIADGLTEFAKQGGAQKEPVDAGIDLVMSLVSAHVDKGIPRALVKTVHLGLITARDKQKKGDYKNDTYTPLLIAGLGMLSVGMESLQAMLPPSDPQPPPPSPLFDSIGELLKMFAELRKDAKGTAAPYEKLAMAMTFLDKAGKMPVVGRYMSPLAKPAQSLLAPDTDQQDYMANLILAELGAARNDNPVNVPKAFKSTCPAFSLDKGVQWSGSPNPNDIFVCAVDMARETVMNNMKGADDPLSPAGMAQNARTVVAGMKRETVFAKTSGDDTLSGISGLLEYRNGQFSRFDFISTFGLGGQFEVASKVTYTSQLLTIEQATSDSRDSGLLANLGLAKAGTNRLFGSDVFSNPVKYMLVQVGGPGSCFNMTADIGADTPLGAVNTGRQGIATCFNPFGFDLKLNSRQNVTALQIDGRQRLFYANGKGGLEIGETIGVYPTVLNYGLFLDALTDLGIGAGVSGIEACGRVEVRAGATIKVSKPSECPANYSFEPANSTKPEGSGVCRLAASLGADFRGGTDYRNFFVKAQAGIGLPLGVYLGGWTYAAKQNDGGFGAFPSDRYGGFTGVTSLSCGRL